MLWMAGAMALGAPIAVLVHLSITGALTRDEKRIWLNELGSAGVWSAPAEYLSSTNLSESAERRAHDTLTTRQRK